MQVRVLPGAQKFRVMDLEGLLIWCIANRDIQTPSDLETFFKGLFSKLRSGYEYNLSINGIKADLDVNLGEKKYHFDIFNFDTLRIEPILHGAGCRHLIGIGICFDVSKCFIIGHTDVNYRRNMSDELRSLATIIDSCCNYMTLDYNGLNIHYNGRSPMEVYEFLNSYGEKNVTKIKIDAPDPGVDSITHIFVNGQLLDEDRYNIVLNIDKAMPNDLYTEIFIFSKNRYVPIRIKRVFREIFRGREQFNKTNV